MPTQPAMTSDNGVILTIGIRTAGDRTAITIPVATDVALTNPQVATCIDAVDAFMDDCAALLCDCLSVDAYLTFVQAEAMMDGYVPARQDFGPTDHPGTRTGSPLPSQVAALLEFYAEPADLLPGARMKMGKNFIPGLSEDDVTGDLISTALQTVIELFGDQLFSGFSQSGGSTWYRVVSAPRPRPTIQQNLCRVCAYMAMLYVGTQRRRLVPRT